MAIQVVTLTAPELQGIISDAYREGYLKAQREWELESKSKQEEPKFGELIKGCKELHHYLQYKGYWKGSLSTLSKVAPQLLEKDDRQGHGLLFRRTCVDHAFKNGFRFKSPDRKNSVVNNIPEE